MGSLLCWHPRFGSGEIDLNLGWVTFATDRTFEREVGAPASEALFEHNRIDVYDIDRESIL